MLGDPETTGGYAGFELEPDYIRRTGNSSLPLPDQRRASTTGVLVRARTALSAAGYNERRNATRSAISFAFSPIWKRWL